MPITSEFGFGFQFEITPRFLAFLDDHRIRTTGKRGVHRWAPGELIFSHQHARLNSFTMMLTGSHISQIGAFSYSHSPLNPFVSIGRYCSLSTDIKVMGPQHATHFVTSSEILYNEQGHFSDCFALLGACDWKYFQHAANRTAFTIGNDVWIGQDVIIKEGLTIGTGAVIGAGATVVKDVAPYEIVGGVPARRIRMRFDDAIIDQLLASEWWRYAVPHMPYLAWDRPERFVSELAGAVESGAVTAFDSDLGSVREIVAETD